MRLFALSAVTLVAVGSYAFAQQDSGQRSNPRGTTNQQDQNSDQHGQHGDQHKDRMNSHLAACILLGNNEEVALGKFAQDKTQNAKVKQFAQRMISDHEKFGQQLMKYAPERAAVELRSNNPGEASENDNNSTTNNERQTTENRTTERNDVASQKANNREEYARGFNADGKRGGPMLQVEREATENCLALTEQEMSRHQGAEFDKCYIGQQIGAHIGMLAKLQTFERHTQGDLQKVFRDGATKTQEHLDQARAIMKELESNRSASSTAAN